MITESFRTMMRYSKYHPQGSPWNYEWSLVETLYYRNYIQKLNVTNLSEQRIPKKIHQIWLGGELPEKYRQFTQSWQTIIRGGQVHNEEEAKLCYNYWNETTFEP